jgi:hypothetical protein
LPGCKISIDTFPASTARWIIAGFVGLTPFVNAEFVWQSPPAMWSQFLMEAGLQASFHWFGRGQTFEVNYSAVTSLQPSRSWRPVLGVVWYQYF